MITTTVNLSYERQTVPDIVPAVQGDTGRNLLFKISDYEIGSDYVDIYYSSSEFMIRKDEYGIEVVTFETSPEMYQAVMGGQVDACYDDTPMLKYNIKIGELDMKFVEGTENDPAQYGFAIFDANKQELVDKGIEAYKADGIDAKG